MLLNLSDVLSRDEKVVSIEDREAMLKMRYIGPQRYNEIVAALKERGENVDHLLK